jgi:hypothetical protein
VKSLDIIGGEGEVPEGVEAVERPLVEQVDGVHLQVQLLQALQPAELVLPQLGQVAERNKFFTNLVLLFKQILTLTHL